MDAFFTAEMYKNKAACTTEEQPYLFVDQHACGERRQ